MVSKSIADGGSIRNTDPRGTTRMTVQTPPTPAPGAPATPAAEPATPAERLAAACGPIVHVPGSTAYDEARVPWNVAVDQRPAAVAVPRTPEEVALVLRAAVDHGLRVAPQGTGHGAAALGGTDLGQAVLLRTTGLQGVTIDPVRRVARVGSGVLWRDVVDAAAPHGLAALHGSSPDVGVAGYALGGGIGWYARKHGLAANSIRAVELVTAGGSVVRADATEHADLFWAVRGGGGSFGVVTALELELFPIAHAYAGMLAWDLDRAAEVLRTWATWSSGAPDEVTTSLRFMRFPPMPELPDFLRGRRLVIVDGAVLGDDARGQEVLEPLRALVPEIDTFTRVPAAALSGLHMDPEGPTPSVGGGLLLAGLDPVTVEAFLDAAGPQSPTTLLVSELRQLGGALGRPAPDGGALDHLGAGYAAFFVGIAATAELAAAGAADVDRVLAALAPHGTGGSFLNLAERPVDPATGYPATTWRRLVAIRDRHDPDRVFLANHPVA
jgi:FAD/FMN-containing dehydrogenase